MDLNYLPLHAISLLTHSSLLNDPNDLLELRKIEKCLKFIIDPLIDSLESTNNISCIKYLIGRVKLNKNKMEPDSECLNIVSFYNLRSIFLSLITKNFISTENVDHSGNC